MSPVIVISAANFASAILMEAGLSFLGIGAQAPIPSWGSMIKDHYGYIILDKAHLAGIPIKKVIENRSYGHVSSTQVRKDISVGASVQETVTKDIVEYIQHHNLYK